MIVDYLIHIYKGDFSDLHIFCLPSEAKAFADFYRKEGYLVMITKRMCERVDL